MKIPRLLGVLAAAAMVALLTASVQGASNPTITSIRATPFCDLNTVCVTLFIDNPVDGTITLKLTGHTPGSSVFVDTGARLAVPILAGEIEPSSASGTCHRSLRAATSTHFGWSSRPATYPTWRARPPRAIASRPARR